MVSMAIDVPVKLYLDKLLKECRKVSVSLALLPGPIKAKALHAMADRVAADAAIILAENAKDVEAVGKSLGSADTRDRMKASVARVRLTADQMTEIVERLHFIADLPDPVGVVMSRHERPDGLQVSTVRVPIGVVGVISERNPLVTAESMALCLKSGNLCVFRGASEWKLTHQALDARFREAATENGIPHGSWVLIDRQEKEVVLDLIRSGKTLDALIVRGGAGLRKIVAEQTKIPVLCDDGGLTHFYIDEAPDISVAQNLVINSKVQQAGASNALDTLLVQQIVGRQFLPPLINRLLDEFKVEVHACPRRSRSWGKWR